MVWGNGRGRDVKANDPGCQALLYFRLLGGGRGLRNRETEIARTERNSTKRRERLGFLKDADLDNGLNFKLF